MTDENNCVRLEQELATARDQRAALVKAISPLAMWWVFVEADRECSGEPPLADETVVLHFMGSGASTMVTAAQLRALVKASGAAQAARKAEQGGRDE